MLGVKIPKRHGSRKCFARAGVAILGLLAVTARSDFGARPSPLYAPAEVP